MIVQSPYIVRLDEIETALMWSVRDGILTGVKVYDKSDIPTPKEGQIATQIVKATDEAALQKLCDLNGWNYE